MRIIEIHGNQRGLVNVLTELGFFGGLLAILLWIRRVRTILLAAKESRSDDLDIEISSMTVFFLVNTLLEGLPPFVLVLSFVFWLLCGYTDAIRPKKLINSYVNAEQRKSGVLLCEK